MSEEIKRMDIKEFREIGLLQEINRQFLHPRGLALEVIIDDETMEESLGGVWDYRDDPEGMYFGEDMLQRSKMENVQAMLDCRSADRKKALGYIVQPIKGKNGN